MNYREPLTKNEIREHAAHYENSNPAIYCGTYAKYNNGSLYGMWVDLSTFENYHDFIEFCNRLHANEAEPELMFQDYEHYPEQWYCEGCMGESTFDKIKAYAELSEETKRILPIGMRARSKISRSATRANTIALKILQNTCARSAATSRTSRSGCNAALIIRQYGAISIRQAITPRSMGTSSGTKGKRGNPLSLLPTS